MRLSFERALAVGTELVNRGYDWRQLRLHACGQNEQLDGPVYEWEGHKKNQRVEVVLSDLLPAQPHDAPAEETP